MCIVLIDSAADNPPLDELRAAALAHPEHQIRFVVILRGQRREPRLEDGALVLVDGNVLTRRALLKAVAVAAGRVKQSGRKDPPDSAGTRRAVPLLSREEARHQGRLILVAEDNEINQKVILQQLALLGQTADVADNGRKAREQWQSGDYGLLLTDLHMPEMDGYELTAAIRAAEAGKSRIPIIAITANALKGEADHCREAGMDDYLSKPVQLVNLKAMLEKWLPSVAGVGRALPADEKKCRSEPDLQQLRSPHDNAGKSPGLHPGDTAAHTVRARRDVPTPPVDVNVLKKLVGDDEATIREFLQDFRSSSARIVTGLRTACAAGEAKAAGDIAHKLKSSACSVGALALGEICAGIEQAGKTGQTVKLAVLLIRFEKELAAVDQYLDAFLTGEKS
jgi:CheY-like chemotaxis protein/HPt (histidine-containing phosphotransfer) domain-containing protein